MLEKNNVDAALSRREIQLRFDSRLGFQIFFEGKSFPLACIAVSKITCKFVDALISSPYFAKHELEEIRDLSHQLERELLKRKPQTESLVRSIELWFRKSALRQSQLKEWLSSAPHLFVSDLLRSQKFEPGNLRDKIS